MWRPSMSSWASPLPAVSPLTLGLSSEQARGEGHPRRERHPDARICRHRPRQDPRAASRLTFPLIAKPVAEDASLGIDDGSVVNDMAALTERVKSLWREFRQAALVEEFIAGRELRLAPRVLAQ